MWGKLSESVLGTVMVIAYLAAGFPGGTIIMWQSCRAYRLDGLDWVLSVLVPFFGPAKALFSDYC